MTEVVFTHVIRVINDFEWMLTLFRIFSAELPATLPEELLKKQFI